MAHPQYCLVTQNYSQRILTYCTRILLLVVNTYNTRILLLDHTYGRTMSYATRRNHVRAMRDTCIQKACI